jgi:hypothetical protein
MVPHRDVGLLVAPARQAEMIEFFLRQPPHEETVVDFKGIPGEDYAVAIVAGLNWLDHCATLAGAPSDNFRRTRRDFRRLVTVAHRWWAIEGAASRCELMLANREIPPLMFYLVWQTYTRLAKEIAIASIERDREKLATSLNSQELPSALAALSEIMMRLKGANDPDDLLRR